MYKWVRVYISLKLFKRGDPPIVLDELWHQNLNKEIFVWDYSSVYLVNDLMIWWLALLLFYTEFLFGIILVFFLCPFHLQVEGGALERDRGHFLWGNSPSSRLEGVWIREYFYLDDFLLPIFSLFCRSRSFALWFDFHSSSRFKEALGRLVVAQLQQDLLRKGSFGWESGILHQF